MKVLLLTLKRRGQQNEIQLGNPNTYRSQGSMPAKFDCATARSGTNYHDIHFRPALDLHRRTKIGKYIVN